MAMPKMQNSKMERGKMKNTPYSKRIKKVENQIKSMAEKLNMLKEIEEKDQKRIRDDARVRMTKLRELHISPWYIEIGKQQNNIITQCHKHRISGKLKDKILKLMSKNKRLVLD